MGIPADTGDVESAAGTVERRNGQASVECVPIASLRPGHSPRIGGEDPDHVRALAENEDGLPPIVVHRPTMRIIDGMHRLRAAQLRGRDKIEAQFFDGTENEAFLLAVRANIAHGLPLSLADRKGAARSLLDKYPEWSDRMIAAKTGLASKTVGAMRDDGKEARVGRDGRVRPVSATEGRQIASEMMRRNPWLSLRKVAKAAGVSPETARDVRRRLSRGEDPVLPRPRSRGRREHQVPAERDHQVAADVADPPTSDLQAAVRQLRTDPSLRLSETGRALLQILSANSVIGHRFDAILDNVPEHCRDTVAKAAEECVQVWRTVANKLES